MTHDKLKDVGHVVFGLINPLVTDILQGKLSKETEKAFYLWLLNVKPELEAIKAREQ